MKTIIFFFFLAILTSCASILSSSKAKITVDNSYPITERVTLTVDKKTYRNVEFPKELKIKRGFKPSIIIGQANGFETDEITVDKKFNGTTLWNFLLGGIPGFAIDAATGAMMKPDEKHYMLNMQPKNYVEKIEESIPKQQTVSRDQVGQTNLERTIIRWYFESEPQGARIFWRVISSCPDQVKNTNELWLGTTPFEETRSFNIQGLTYENARDVQIEIKVRRNGYIDQSKRFNVRQAIDQQEISSFFEMIKKEE